MNCHSFHLAFSLLHPNRALSFPIFLLIFREDPFVNQQPDLFIKLRCPPAKFACLVRRQAKAFRRLFDWKLLGRHPYLKGWFLYLAVLSSSSPFSKNTAQSRSRLVCGYGKRVLVAFHLSKSDFQSLPRLSGLTSKPRSLSVYR